MKNIFIILVILIGSAYFMVSCSYKNIFNSDTIKQIPLEEYLSKIEENEDIIIIDVRTAAEYKKGHFPNAINVSLLGSFKKNTKDLDNTKTAFIYCETAHRSPFATRFLKQKGFTKIYDLDKGYSQYRKFINSKKDD